MKTAHITALAPLAALAFTLAAGCGAAPLNQRLPGRYVSATCEAAGSGIYVKRDFTLTATSWQLAVGIFNDAACQTQSKFVDVGVTGPYQVKGDSAVVAGASEVDYSVTTHTVTPASAAAVQTLTQGGCGTGTRAVGQPVDVTQTGCAPLGIPTVAACPFEMDLNKLDGDNLYFGDRSGDLCKARPTQLGTLPVVLQK